MTAALRMPTLVVVDLDDTLYPYAPSHAAGTAALLALGTKETGVDAARFTAVLAEARTKVKQRVGTTGASHSRLLYISEALAALGFGSRPALALNLEAEYWRHYIVEMRLREHAETLLSSMRYNHIAIAIVTDLTAQIQFRKLVHLRLDAVADYVVVSEECAGDKSTLAPFDVLADRVRDDLLENVWFIGDGPQDAPVEQLIERGVIKSGIGWVKDAPSGDPVRGWRSLEEIQSALTPLYG